VRVELGQSLEVRVRRAVQLMVIIDCQNDGHSESPAKARRVGEPAPGGRSIGLRSDLHA
jgi:hypothetical protein